MKTCPTCKTTKESTEFYKNKSNKDGKHHQCRECCLAYQRNPIYKEAKKKQVKENAEYLKKARQTRHFQNTYGLSRLAYDNMRESQNYCCYICGLHETENHNKILCVDHNHDTGEVRKLLCSKCNRGLGLFNDSSGLLAKASQYLELYGKP